MYAAFEGIQIILIEDLHVLPFIDIQINPFAITASDWTRALHADVDFVLQANNFNFKNSHWEPIIEPWSFCIKVAQDATDKSTQVSLQSKDLLYMNITHVFLESLLTVSATLSESRVSIICHFNTLSSNYFPIETCRNCPGSSKTLPHSKLYWI